jgi:hypothetical protein
VQIVTRPCPVCADDDRREAQAIETQVNPDPHLPVPRTAGDPYLDLVHAARLLSIATTGGRE